MKGVDSHMTKAAKGVQMCALVKEMQVTEWVPKGKSQRMHDLRERIQLEHWRREGSLYFLVVVGSNQD